jgi:ABC-type dipeptide/oligopeptide/nickel transport system permease component
MGMSLQHRSPVSPLVLERLQNSMILVMASLFLATSLGLAAGIVSATRPGSLIDRTMMALALFGNSMPYFWLGLMAIVVFSLHLGWFPTGGMWPVVGDRTLGALAHHLFLPAATLGVSVSAVIARMTRASMLEVIRQDYIRTAQAKGLAAQRILTRHALKNALLPILTVVGMQFGFLLGGAVLTETIFAWPGLGFTLFNAISFRDYPLVLGSILVVATAFVLLNLAVDILYAYVDPRIHYQ